MQYYSQHDPAYDRQLLGHSKLTVHGYGCFIVSLANFFQKSPETLLKISGGIDANGNTVSAVIAKACDGEALPMTTIAPKGWCIGVTNKYAPQFPTHFLCVNMDTKQQIDPLDFPAKPEPLTYNIIQFRPFHGGALPPFLETQPTGPFPDVELSRWSAKDIAEAKRLGWISGYLDGTFKPAQPMTREEVVALLMKATRI